MFVTFEGIEGAGKSTAISHLAEFLREQGHDPVCTREPGGSVLGRSLRSLLLDARTGVLSSRAELFLFLADRAQHLAEVVRPALEAGQVVLCDRYTDSTLAYQGYGRGLDIEQLRSLDQMATGGLKPDLTLLLDVPVRCGLERAGERNKALGTVVAEGRFDAESLDFHERVRAGYLALAAEEPDRFAIVQAAESPEDIVLQCRSALETCLHLRGRGLD
ncbi:MULTISPECIES: dTMP kinase [unclassified Desulfovibrio]|uniref:dTMP kinase n=1 Tax=unclassified Desulfovibrio TaxID=2593640 RepID=UPI000F5E4AB7|nr:MULTISPECIES: dTMP kinase [unclassified Desulfovibrio]RRD71707.1 dTMP kinase [Desulfovibrio sp. OH1209_COT-279]RRD87920.1 dTMP kinase [Desulfovibrio sp. OH1186_COT-070]